MSKLGLTLKSIAKLILLSRKSTVSHCQRDKSIIIMGNGPSLNQTITEDREAFHRLPLMAVNFAVLTPEFQEFKPEFYILADPLFFAPQPIEKVQKLLTALDTVTWEMTLFIPMGKQIRHNQHIKIEHYNYLGLEGAGWLTRRAYRTGRGMPRPQNVLIPALMTAIHAGFKRIYVAGADHSWLRTLDISDQNEVISAQDHYYKDDEKEQKRIIQMGSQRKLHEMLMLFSITFKAHHDVNKFACEQGVEIINVTPRSMIDAYKRGKISD